MKNFTVSAIMAMGVVTLSSAAFAGTSPYAPKSTTQSALASDTVVPADTIVTPTDTIVPEKKDTIVNKTFLLCQADTVTPADTLVPDKKSGEQKYATLFLQSDTVVPADTLKRDSWK